MKSNQFLFNKAVRGLLKQGCKSVSDDRCEYRGPNDLRCGVGMVMPNACYSQDMEGQSIEYLQRNYPERLARFGIGEDNVSLLGAIQGVHDREDVDAWPTKFKALATDYGLKMPRIAA